MRKIKQNIHGIHLRKGEEHKRVLFSNAMAETISKALWFVGVAGGGCFSAATTQWEHKPQ